MRLFKRNKRIRPKTYSRRPLLHNQRRFRRNGINNLTLPNLVKLKKWSVLIGTLATAIVISYFLFFSNQLSIKEIQVYKDQSLEANSPLQFYFNSAINQSIVFSDLSEVQNKILTDNPQIDKIAIKKKFPSTIKIEYTEFSIVANLLLSAEEVQQKYLLNSQGQVARKDIENPNLPFIKMTAVKALKSQEQAIDPEKLKYILESRKAFEEKFGIKVFDVTYLKEARELHLRTEKYFYVWLDMTQNYDKQFSKLKKSLNTLDIYNDPIDYIDLRISGTNGEKVIFKRKK